MERIFLLEDDDSIRKLVIYALGSQGYEAQGFDRPSDFWKAMEGPQPALVLLDIMLPEEDGLSILQKLRASAATKRLPVIMLTAKNTEYDRVVGLDSGADDFISKPFGMMELVARVRSQLRRYTRLGDVNASARDRRIVSGRLSYDPDSRVLTADGDEVKLTATELGILDLLMCNLGRVFPAEEIYRRVWGEEAYASENTVMVHIRRIREKIELNPREPDYLKVVWGIGYKMEKHP